MRVKQLINKANTTAADDNGRPTNAEIVQALEESRAEIYSELFDWLADRRAASTTMTYTADTAAVALPSAAQDTQVLQVYAPASSIAGASQRTLNPIRIAEFANVGESGTPVYYCITGTDLRLRPMPMVDTSLVLLYLPKLSVLSASTSPAEIPSAWHHIYAYAAAIKLRHKNNDPAEGLETDFRAQMQRLTTLVERRSNDNHIQTVDNTNNFWST
ncbi:MAG: hypothetical protein IPL77_11130 [Flavobacteriales bacterium]|nr:hypothetical protein [Flavobacteriales bacterium]